MTKKLVAFYSRADENYVNGMLKKLDIGNTENSSNYDKRVDRCRYIQN